MDNVTIIALQNLHPFPKPPVDCRLVGQVFQGVMICLDDEVAAGQIMPPFPNSPGDAQKFPLICTIPGLSRVELPAFIANGLQPVAKVLLQDTSDGHL